jgi:hypothetical protein
MWLHKSSSSPEIKRKKHMNGIHAGSVKNDEKGEK